MTGGGIVIIVVVQGLIFLTLILILRRFMQGHVTGAVGHLSKMNDDLVKQQADLKQKIVSAEEEYQSKMAVIQREISSVQADARQEAARLIEDAKDRSMQERESMINEAIATREKMRQEIMEEMEEKAVTYSKDLIGEFFSGDLRQLIHEQLVLQLIHNLREVDTEHFQIHAEHAELKVAHPLRDDQKKQLEKILQDKIKKDFSFKEDVDTSLIGGLILRFGTLIIDGSLTHRLNEASAILKKETMRRYQGKT